MISKGDIMFLGLPLLRHEVIDALVHCKRIRIHAEHEGFVTDWYFPASSMAWWSLS